MKQFKDGSRWNDRKGGSYRVNEIANVSMNELHVSVFEVDTDTVSYIFQVFEIDTVTEQRIGIDAVTALKLMADAVQEAWQ